MRHLRWLDPMLLVALALCFSPAYGQIAPGGGVQQSGAVTPNNCTKWVSNGVIADAGACGGGSGTVTSVSVTTANGVSGSVATATTTPAISLTLGAITPTTVNGNTLTTGSGTLTLGAAKTVAISNTLTLTATDGSTLAIGAGGTLGSNAYTSTSFAPVASPTFTGTVTIPNGGVFGVPTSITLTNGTGLPISSGVSGMGANVAAFLATPSSVNFAAALTDKSGTGSVVFNTQPVFGTCSSNKAAPTNSNMNLYLYNASSTNFQGIGCDNATGDLFFATGTSGPANRLSIAASGLVSFPSTTTGTNAFFACLDTNNGLLRQAAPCTISSVRFKDMGPMVGPAEALSKVMLLQPVSFTMKKELQSSDINSRRVQLGLTAENVASVDKRASVWEDDGKTPKSYRPESIISLLVGAVHELKADNEDLRKKLMALASKRRSHRN